MSLQCIPLKQFPDSLTIPQQILFYEKQNCLLIINNRSECIYKYNLKNNDYSIYYQSNNSMKSFSVINTKTDELITLFAKGRKLICFELNLENQKFREFIINNNRKCSVNANILYLPSPMNEIYLFGKRYHYKFSKNQLKLEEIHLNIINPFYSYSKIIFIKSLNKLISFGCNEWDEIWCCDMKNNKQIKYEWKLMNIKIPTDMIHVSYRDYYFFNVYNTIIVGVYDSSDKIWLLDLLNIDDGWCESDKKFKNPHFFDVSPITARNYIYFVFKSRICKISIKNVLTKSLYNKYGLMYFDIINGYFKLIKKTYKINYSMPIVLLHLIVRYYCDFR